MQLDCGSSQKTVDPQVTCRRRVCEIILVVLELEKVEAEAEEFFNF